jgi:hypothetical protein
VLRNFDRLRTALGQNRRSRTIPEHVRSTSVSRPSEAGPTWLFRAMNRHMRCSKILGGNLGSRLAVAAFGQANREHRASAQLARHGHVAAHHARELARERKAEPRPAVAAGGERIRLGKFLE